MTPWDGQPMFEGEIPKPVATMVSRGPSGRLRRVKPSEVVVSRTDLEAVVNSPDWEEGVPDGWSGEVHVSDCWVKYVVVSPQKKRMQAAIVRVALGTWFCSVSESSQGAGAVEARARAAALVAAADKCDELNGLDPVPQGVPEARDRLRAALEGDAA